MDQVPFEILCKILSYLNTYDLMQFCEAYGSNCFLKETRSVDLSRRFDLKDVNLHTLITRTFNCYIKRLNIDYIYWVSPSELRALINQLKNLEELHAFDTSLGLHSEDIQEYIKLKKLAVSINLADIDEASLEESRKLTSLKSLGVCIIQKLWPHNFQVFLRNIPHLEELWISDEDTRFERINYQEIISTVKNMQTLVIKSKTPVRGIDYICSEFSQIFQCKRNGPTTELIFEKEVIKPECMEEYFSYQEKSSKLEEIEPEKSLKMFDTFLHDVPYGPVESIKRHQIFINRSLENIYFEDLNFCQPVILCSSKYIDGAIQILSSKYSTKLKRLKFRSCLLRAPQLEVARQTDDGRWPNGEGISMSPNSFWMISDNLENVTELEIEICPECNDAAIISAYFAIQKLVNLHRLSLEIPSLMDGSFLNRVFDMCDHLEYLNLTCVVSNEQFIANLYKYIKYANNLKHFRLEHKHISLDHLLDSLNGISSKKLLRIFVNCTDLSYDTAHEKTPVYKFVQNNPQLVFLVIGNNNYKNLDEDQNKLLTLMETNIANIYWVNPIHLIKQQYYRAHRDIFLNLNNVSSINIDTF